MDQRRPASGTTSSSSLDWAQGKRSAWAPGTQSAPKFQTQHNLSQFHVGIVPHELVPKTIASSLQSHKGHSPLTVTADSYALSGLCWKENALSIQTRPFLKAQPKTSLLQSSPPTTTDNEL